MNCHLTRQIIYNLSISSTCQLSQKADTWWVQRCIFYSEVSIPEKRDNLYWSALESRTHMSSANSSLIQEDPGIVKERCWRTLFICKFKAKIANIKKNFLSSKHINILHKCIHNNVLLWNKEDTSEFCLVVFCIWTFANMGLENIRAKVFLKSFINYKKYLWLSQKSGNVWQLRDTEKKIITGMLKILSALINCKVRYL